VLKPLMCHGIKRVLKKSASGVLWGREA